MRHQESATSLRKLFQIVRLCSFPGKRHFELLAQVVTWAYRRETAKKTCEQMGICAHSATKNRWYDVTKSTGNGFHFAITCMNRLQAANMPKIEAGLLSLSKPNRVTRLTNADAADDALCATSLALKQ